MKTLSFFLLLSLLALAACSRPSLSPVCEVRRCAPDQSFDVRLCACKLRADASEE